MTPSPSARQSSSSGPSRPLPVVEVVARLQHLVARQALVVGDARAPRRAGPRRGSRRRSRAPCRPRSAWRRRRASRRRASPGPASATGRRRSPRPAAGGARPRPPRGSSVAERSRRPCPMSAPTLVIDDDLVALARVAGQPVADDRLRLAALVARDPGRVGVGGVDGVEPGVDEGVEQPRRPVASSAVQPKTLPPSTSGAISNPVSPRGRFCIGLAPCPAAVRAQLGPPCREARLNPAA